MSTKVDALESTSGSSGVHRGASVCTAGGLDSASVACAVLLNSWKVLFILAKVAKTRDCEELRNLESTKVRVGAPPSQVIATMLTIWNPYIPHCLG